MTEKDEGLEETFQKPFSEPTDDEKAKKKKMLIIIAIVASIVVIAVVVVLCVVLLRKKKDEEEDKPEEDLEFTEAEHRELSRNIATQGMVLAKNNGLPIQPTDKVVLFGSGTAKTCYGGWGSGEVYDKGTTHSVTPIHIVEGMKAKGDDKKCKYVENTKGYELISTNLTIQDIEEFAKKEGSERTVAVLTITRRSGEGSDRTLDSTESGIRLTDAEKETYKALETNFDKVVIVLNVGSVMEIEELLQSDKTSILISFLPGFEAGNAIADVLVGDANPSGHLSDTWAKTINDYSTTTTFLENLEYVKYKEGLFMGYRYFEDDEEKQSKVVFPFGHGLSYTTFKITNKCNFNSGEFTITSTVKNTGDRSGKQVVQVYAEKPYKENFVKAKRELVAFAKTKELRKGESQTLTMKVKLDNLASYDDTGVTGNKACYVLEAGEYKLYVGTSVAEVRGSNGLVYTHKVDSLKVVEKLTTRLAPKDKDVQNSNTKPDFNSFMNKTNKMQYDQEQFKNEIPLRASSPLQSIRPRIPSDDFAEINFRTVVQKKNTMEELVDTMTNEEMAYLAYGHGKLIRTGTGSIGGFYNDEITGKYLIPSADTNDGPAGLRQSEVVLGSVAWPCSTLLASTFDEKIMNTVGEETGKEARKIGTSFWLAPGMNIHRSPLCGRNFEYYSEDPFLTGKMAAAITRGLQSKRVSITLKHFAFNDKEENRGGSSTLMASDSRMSERVAREIYLKGFEIAVKEGNPWAIMTSYNRMNGMKTAESYDLLTGILRNEWGFDGLVMTDWGSNSLIAREIQGGGNVKMPSGDTESIMTALTNGLVTRNELKQSTLHILKTLQRTACFDNLLYYPEPIDLSGKQRIKVASHIYNKYPGISYEDCKDEDGGYNPTNTATGSWISLYVTNKKAGYRTARIRYASDQAGFGVNLKKYYENLGEIANLHASGTTKQDWKTSVNFTVFLPEGTYELTLFFFGYEYGVVSDTYKGNINWIEFDEYTE